MSWHAFGAAVRSVAAAVDYLVTSAARVDWPFPWINIVPPFSIEVGIGLAHILRSTMTTELCMWMILFPSPRQCKSGEATNKALPANQPSDPAKDLLGFRAPSKADETPNVVFEGILALRTHGL